MGRNVTVGVAGATGSLGREVLRLLDEAPWRPDQVQAFARASTTADFVEYGEQRLTVDALEHFDPAQLDLLIVATPAEAATAAIDAAVAADVPVVDLSGSQLEDLGVPVLRVQAAAEGWPPKPRRGRLEQEFLDPLFLALTRELAPPLGDGENEVATEILRGLFAHRKLGRNNHSHEDDLWKERAGQLRTTQLLPTV